MIESYNKTQSTWHRERKNQLIFEIYSLIQSRKIPGEGERRGLRLRGEISAYTKRSKIGLSFHLVPRCVILKDNGTAGRELKQGKDKVKNECDFDYNDNKNR